MHGDSVLVVVATGPEQSRTYPDDEFGRAPIPALVTPQLRCEVEIGRPQGSQPVGQSFGVEPRDPAGHPDRAVAD